MNQDTPLLPLSSPPFPSPPLPPPLLPSLSLSSLLLRLESIAADAELQEKSLSELARLADTLRDGCLQAETQHRAHESGDQETNSRRDKGAILRLSGVTIGAGSILRREEELQALAACIPDNEAARRR